MRIRIDGIHNDIIDNIDRIDSYSGYQSKHTVLHVMDNVLSQIVLLKVQKDFVACTRIIHLYYCIEK